MIQIIKTKKTITKRRILLEVESKHGMMNLCI